MGFLQGIGGCLVLKTGKEKGIFFKKLAKEAFAEHRKSFHRMKSYLWHMGIENSTQQLDP